MKYCSNTHRRKADSDKLSSNTSYGKSWNFIQNADETPCRLCNKKAYPVHCTMCGKYSCYECTTMDEDFATMCYECLEIAEKKEEVEMIPCSDCGELVPLNEDNANEFVFDDYEIYCKKCMQHMRELV